jgi:hypothetical protein
LALSLPAAGQSTNLLTNSGAEEVKDGRPAGFGMYVGAGKMSLTASAESPHGGSSAAKLTFEDWYQAEGKPAQISGSLLIGGGNGYQPDGSLEAVEGSFGYAFEFWARSDLGLASVSVWTWDANGVRNSVSARPNTVTLTGEWQRVSGRFSLPAGTKHFALGLGTSGKQADGAKLGWLEVDDTSITSIGFPGGELRAMWNILPSNDPKEGPAAIDERVAHLKAMKINAAFCWTTSLYIAAATGMEPGGDPAAEWDAFGRLLTRAHEAGIQIHVWYSPWIYKGSSRGIELRRHPEWAAVNAEGKPCAEGICLARPEVRAFQLELLQKFVERYPAIDGIHIEEPGYHWGDYCYCDYCKKTFKDLFGIELKPGENAESRHNWAAFCSTDFMARLREQLAQQKPGTMLSSNGSAGANPDWYLGRDWTTWARRGYIDFYVPQIYTESVNSFRKSLRVTQKQGEPWCRVVPGMAISWSGIHPRRNTTETLVGEITAAREGAAPGFVIFHAAHATDEDVKAIGALTEK